MPSPTSPADRPWRASLGRSVRLFRDFRHEQDDPARFYTALASDSAAHVVSTPTWPAPRCSMSAVARATSAMRSARSGATYFSLDADVGELSGLGEIVPGTVIGSGLALPFRDDAVDVCYSSNVLEHVPDPWLMADEMLRVTKPGWRHLHQLHRVVRPVGRPRDGAVALPRRPRARRRYARKHGKEPKNKYGESLFTVTVAAGLAWAGRQQGAEVLDLAPRYNPRWSRWLMRVPVVREVVTWNLVIVLRKR